MSAPQDIDGVFVRRLEPSWDAALIAASIGISFLGSFTSCALMCQARISVHFLSVLLWTAAASFIFGFCSIWALHEVAMLACKLDVPIGVNAPLTIVSAVLAVVFTWTALGTDILWDRYKKYQKKRRRQARKAKRDEGRYRDVNDAPGSTPLLRRESEDVEDAEDDDEDEDEGYFDGEASSSIQFRTRQPIQTHDYEPTATSDRASVASNPISPGTVLLKPPSGGFQYDAAPEQSMFSNGMSSASKAWLASGQANGAGNGETNEPSVAKPTNDAENDDTNTRTSSDWSSLRRESSSFGGSSSGYLGLGINSAMGVMYRRGASTSNAFVAIAKALYAGCSVKNICKGLFWSLAVTSMHYVGIHGLKVPDGYYTLNPWLVLASALISWVVCIVGVILMANMETQLGQQLLFSAVATAGVAAMHFTGMHGVTFWSSQKSSSMRGYPSALANSVIAVAGITCIVANLLLAQSATASRNKLAEIVWTRKELWKAIAQKENAEAAALARSEFVASASHEIRTPLHHLQGYADLLGQQDLTEEGRALLSSIQRATKTLSMITTNVLDWSKLERNAETAYRPTALDIREVCESIVALLPNIDDEANVEIFLIVSPDVPSTLFLDESYIHRILMNLLSNALKFTMTGYVMLSIQIFEGKLVAKVEDTGVGIDPEFLPRLFQPFEQGEVRGKARGSGLGCAIIKELLQKMSGTIEVKSQFRSEDPDSSIRSGSTFTLTLPLQTTSPLSEHPKKRQSRRVGLLVCAEDSIYSDGLQSSWSTFDYETHVAKDLSELPPLQYTYLWADAEYLRKNPSQFHLLLQRTQSLVLVPSNSQDTLRELPGLQKAPHFIVLQKPLMWHLFDKRIQQQQQRPANAVPTKTLRFAPEVEVMSTSPSKAAPSIPLSPPAMASDAQPPAVQRPTLIRKASRKACVLIVEDNPINQKLGCKMLTALGYDVLTADDGQAGIEQLLAHDNVVDAVLMDESMPRKCGTQATKEIREMEASGKLVGRAGSAGRRRPIIAVTAVVNPRAQQSFKEAGADDFLAKPLSLVKLRDTLAVHLGQT